MPCAAVGQGSPRAPKVAVLEWGAAEAPLVALCGKGVCFDTGGLDLKPSSAMLRMKKDMGGAAVMLALAEALVHDLGLLLDEEQLELREAGVQRWHHVVGRPE